MKRFLFLIVWLYAATVHAQPARVNTARCDNTGPTTAIVCPAFVATTGNTIVVFVKSANNFTVGVSDTAGNTYSLVSSNHLQNPQEDEFRAKNVTGNASNVVTVTFGTTDSSTFAYVLQYSGLNTTEPNDLMVADDYRDYGNEGTDHTSDRFTTSQAAELVLMFTTARNGVTTPVFTVGSGFTLVVGNLTPGSGDNELGAVQEMFTSSILTNYTAHITTDTLYASTTLLSTYKAASAPPATSSKRLLLVGAGK